MLGRKVLGRRAITVFAGLGLTFSVQANGLPPEVIQALQAAQIPVQQVAVVVTPVAATSPLISHRPQAVMNPASVMKLVTTFAALDLLGPAYTWKTTASSTASTVDGVLQGNLTLKGSGDPRFTQESLSHLLRRLRVRGIQHIAGDIVLDRSLFQLPAHDPAAFDQQPMRPYNVGADALLLNFHTLRLTLEAQVGQPQLWLETPLANISIDNQLNSSDGPCPSDWKEPIQMRLLTDKSAADTSRYRLILSGRYPLSCGEKTLNLAPFGPEAYADTLIRALWSELGGTFTGKVVSGTQAPGSQRLAVQESPQLAEIVRDINKFSNNVMARQVFLALAGEESPRTLPAARQQLKAWLGLHGQRFPELEIDNGSGLSRQERISADSLNRLLLRAWQSPVMPEFIASLPIVGVDGTMKKRLKSASVAGRAHIKTGSLEGVKTAAGYVLDQQGRRYAVTFFINHPRASAGGAAIDALLLWVAEQGK